MPETRTTYQQRVDAMHARIAERIGAQPVVYYSAYETGEGGLPVDNLDHIPVEGELEFCVEHEPFWGSGCSYKSALVTSPTWLEIAVLADDMIRTTGDYHHRFLEGVKVITQCGDLKTVEFVRGS